MNKNGFVIANEHAEYLHYFSCDEGIETLGWTLTPMLAMVFPSRSKCEKVIRRIHDGKYSLWLLSIVETKTQVIVGCSDRVQPPWFANL